MYIPTINKILNKNGIYVERVLPKGGDLVVSIGDVVEPFTKLGMSKVSYGVMPIGKGLHVAKGKLEDGFFYMGEKVGRVRNKTIKAPFDGTLMKEGDSYYLRQVDREFWLLSGVWGTVVDLVEKNSVLLKSQVTDIHLAVSTKGVISGELIVYPNPSELLEMQYLEKFSKDSFGKVLYVGDFVSTDFIKKAYKLGVGGIIAGSADRAAFIFAEQNGMFLGVFSGFGHIPTPGIIFDMLKEKSSRFIFADGPNHILRIPMTAPFQQDSKRFAKSVLRKLKKGMNVQVFDKAHFGFSGKVEDIQGDVVYVMLDGVSETIEVRVPNILSLE